MTARSARPDDIDRIISLIRADKPTVANLPANESTAIAVHIRRDIENPAGPLSWLIVEEGPNLEATAHLAVIPPPPIYAGGIVGIILGHWSAPGIAAERIIAAAEDHLLTKNVTKLIGAAPPQSPAARELERRGYKATTHFMTKAHLTATPPAPSLRPATESDIDALVAFNRVARVRLHEANPTFWTSHPDADQRFGLWMKFSLTMRDRAMLISTNGAGFIIAQPSSPIQLPLTIDPEKVGAIDDFHDAAFGTSLTNEKNTPTGAALLAAAENDFIARGKTASLAICPAAWPAKQTLLTRAGYEVHHTWFVKDL